MRALATSLVCVVLLLAQGVVALQRQGPPRTDVTEPLPESARLLHRLFFAAYPGLSQSVARRSASLHVRLFDAGRTSVDFVLPSVILPSREQSRLSLLVALDSDGRVLSLVSEGPELDADVGAELFGALRENPMWTDERATRWLLSQGLSVSPPDFLGSESRYLASLGRFLGDQVEFGAAAVEWRVGTSSTSLAHRPFRERPVWRVDAHGADSSRPAMNYRLEFLIPNGLLLSVRRM